jgi:uncharacterized membrane protein YfcA
MSEGTLWLGAVVLVAGLVRGFSGFGAGLFMAPLLSLLIGPIQAVPLLVLLDATVSVVLLPGAWRSVSRGVTLLLGLPAAAAIPAGAALLVILDPLLVARIISGVVLVFVVAVALGWRYRGAPGKSFTAATGAASGVLTGIGGIGGPPVILFYLSGRNGDPGIRANLIGFFAITQAAALVIFASQGLLVQEVLWRFLYLAPVFLVSAWLGARLFGGRAGRAYRRIAYLLLAASALMGMLAGGPANG